MFLKMSRIVAAFALLAAAPAMAAEFTEGKHYTVVAPEATAEPEVLEFFSYGCGGCYVFDSWFQQMKGAIGDDVAVRYVPVDFGGGFWTPAQEIFLVLDALGRREELHNALFQFIHGERNPISPANARVFAERHGISEEEYEKALKSFAVHVKESRYDQLTQRFRIRSTPTVIVNGKYQIDHTTLSGPAEFVELVQYLLRKK